MAKPAKSTATAPAKLAPAEGRTRQQVERALVRAEANATKFGVPFGDSTPTDLRDLPTVGALRSFLAANPRTARYEDVPAVTVREIIRATRIVKGKIDGDKTWAKAVLAARDETAKRDKAAKKAAKLAAESAKAPAAPKAPEMSLDEARKVLAAHGMAVAETPAQAKAS